MSTAIIIGAGPAGLMAAQELARQGVQVTICDAKPSFGRKFLMAGKSGLNLTKDEPLAVMLPHFAKAQGALEPMLAAFDAGAVKEWAATLGQPVFTGSTGRVFPTAMKASPLLRAWLSELEALGVKRLTKMRWTGWDGDELCFDGVRMSADVTVLALGGASWSRLGSDGGWADILAAQGVALAPFAPANVGLRAAWSGHMDKYLGRALKGIAFSAGGLRSRGEAVISQTGLEGGGVYEVSAGFRNGAPLVIDLLPDMNAVQIAAKLNRTDAKASISNRLRKALRLDPVKIAILNEVSYPLPKDIDVLAGLIKAVQIPHNGPMPMDQAISTAGGVPFDALDDGLMLCAKPGVFCAGEMLDWEAPTGGYLITACLATGRWAGQAAARYLRG